MSNKEKAIQIINDRINQMKNATNNNELECYEYFAHGSAVTLWEMGIFNKQEHTENYNRIVNAAKNKKY